MRTPITDITYDYASSPDQGSNEIFATAKALPCTDGSTLYRFIFGREPATDALYTHTHFYAKVVRYYYSKAVDTTYLIARTLKN